MLVIEGVAAELRGEVAAPVQRLLSSSFRKDKAVVPFIWSNGIDGQRDLTRFMKDLYPGRRQHVEFEEKGGQALFSI